MTTRVPTPPATAEPLAAAPPARTFTADEVEKFRQEEREKLNKDLAREKAARAEQAKELKELRSRAKADAEKDLSVEEILAAREAEWTASQAEREAAVTAQLAQIEEDRERDRALIRLEHEALELQSYINQQVTAALNDHSMAPQFVDFITGYSTAEVDASIALAQEKTAEIASELQGQQAPAPRPRGVSTNFGPSSMGSRTEVEGETPDVRGLSLRDFIRNRDKLIPKGKDQGLFG
jgi:hypothetical protein